MLSNGPMDDVPRRRTPEECPVCGAQVPRGAQACPNCGADERSGWNEDATRYDGLDLPEQAFEDESTLSGRSPNGRGRRAASIFWWIRGIGCDAGVYLPRPAGAVLNGRTIS